jgi:hypothetical protein
MLGEQHLLRLEADRIHIGDVVGDHVQVSAQCPLVGKGNDETVFHPWPAPYLSSAFRRTLLRKAHANRRRTRPTAYPATEFAPNPPARVDAAKAFCRQFLPGAPTGRDGFAMAVVAGRRIRPGGATSC